MAKVIIFGIVETAELAYYYLKNDSEHEVVAFCVDHKYLPEEKYFKSLPIVDFDNVEELYPVKEYKFFAPMSPSKMNTLREKIYNSIKKKGYDCISYVSSKAIVFNTEIGENCFVQEGNTLQPFTKLGNNVMIWSDNTVAHHTVVKDHVTIASHVMVGGHSIIGENSLLALNSSIPYGTNVAKGTHVRMGSVLYEDTEEMGEYLGNPAQKIDQSI